MRSRLPHPRRHTAVLLVVALLATGATGCRALSAALSPSTASLPEDGSPPAPHSLATQLGAGDLFEARVYQEPELSGMYRVGSDGSIDFPFCGRLAVAGLTTQEVASLLTRCLADGFLRSPQVTVVAREYNSKKIFVFGHVQKSGTYPFEDGMTIVQAVTLAGGFSQFAGQNAIAVTRSTPDGERRFRVPVQDIAVGKVPNFHLQPGDIIFVPESAF